MNDHRRVAIDADHALEVFAAELTAAAYAAALRHGGGVEWLDLELDLWRVLTETVKKWAGGPASRTPRTTEEIRYGSCEADPSQDP
jgi:hypothetical protein